MCINTHINIDVYPCMFDMARTDSFYFSTLSQPKEAYYIAPCGYCVVLKPILVPKLIPFLDLIFYYFNGVFFILFSP